MVFTSPCSFMPVPPQGGPQVSLIGAVAGHYFIHHTMSMYCAASGCSSPTAGRSTFCNKHRATKRRHGHHLQTSVSTTELQPFVKEVSSRWSRSPDNEAWAILSARWSLLVEHARQEVAKREAGAPVVKHHVMAAEQVSKLADTVAARSIIQTTLAMYLLQHAQPHRFKSDGAFGVQLVRRVRSLSSLGVGRTWDAKAKRMKSTYKDFPPRAAEVLARLLADAFAVPGMQLAGIVGRVKADREAAKLLERQRLADAIEWLADA